MAGRSDVTQHTGLSPERWAAFTLDQQILMIGNEMNRAAGWMAPEDRTALTNAYARILRLTDLTIQVQTRRTLRRELLRWRDLAAALYLTGQADPERHAVLFRTLLRFTAVASRQIPLLPATRTGGAPPSWSSRRST
jgi:hypothetical protein